jgi:hypothetical protein
MAKGQVIRKRFGKLIRGAKQMAGAGDMSDAPRYQKGRRAGAKPPSGIPPKESAKLARKKQQIGRAKVRARGGKKALQIEWDDLIPSAKRAEKKKFMEGKETPFDSIIKKMKKDTRKPVELVSQKEANEAAMKEAEKTLGIKKSDWGKKSGGVVKKAGGGMTRQGLYPAEMARAGTMSQARRKRYMKKGGSISYKMTGGQVVSHGYD